MPSSGKQSDPGRIQTIRAEGFLRRTLRIRSRQPRMTVSRSASRLFRARIPLASLDSRRIQTQSGGHREKVIRGAAALIRKVRKHNPSAKIVWILPATDCHPELGAEAVRRVQQEGMKDVYSFVLPDYGPDEMGARWHPNAEYNRKAGEVLAEFLRKLQ